MKAEELPAILGKELERRRYFIRLDVIEQTLSLVKIRLYISPDLFVQIYNGQRLYARDELEGSWHRHTVRKPEDHDKSREGRRPVEIDEFLDEVENVLAALGLP